MRKTFVLDTNVLLQTPFALYSFGDNIIVIPEVVLEELDRFKKDNSELGANARHAARIIVSLLTLSGRLLAKFTDRKLTAMSSLFFFISINLKTLMIYVRYWYTLSDLHFIRLIGRILSHFLNGLTFIFSATRYSFSAEFTLPETQ